MDYEKINIKFTIQKDEPIDIKALADALLALNNSIDEYIYLTQGASGIKTTLKSVEKGSDIFNLLVCGSLMFNELLPSINAYFEFFNNIKNISKKSVDEIKNDKLLTKNTLENIEKIVNLAEQKDLNLSLVYNDYKDCVIINQENKEFFKQGIDTAKKIKNYEDKELRHFENVLIKMKEVKESERIVRDKAICDDIVQGKAISAEIVDKEAKELINKNPFDNYYLVDLSVHKIDGFIKLYRITKLHNIIPKDKKEVQWQHKKLRIFVKVKI